MKQESIQIGSTVRIRWPSNRQQGRTSTVSRRGIIATINNGNEDNTTTCSVILEDLVPTPLMDNFLIFPIMNNNTIEESEVEVPMSEIEPLLPFEQSSSDVVVATTVDNDVTIYKKYADDLFKLHDYTNAISYYEAALHRISSNLTNVGGTIVARRNGHCVVAEIDCVENSDDGDSLQCDVTFITSNGEMEEGTISSKDILLSLWDQDMVLRRGKREKQKEKFLQPRILLNLCRCLLHLAEIIDTSSSSDTKHQEQRRMKYKKSAVLGSSIAITLCEYYNNQSDSESHPLLSSLLEKAFLLRSKAFISIGKLSNAFVDAKKVSNQNPNNREAAELIRDVKSLEKRKKIADKKLSKEVCRWIQSATGDL
eukprot:scaffold21258_cov58-Cyclotella_meneghiniana.AAC.5